jgi:hypothetical protein
MSLEAKIEALTQAVQALTAQLQSANETPVAPAPVPAPVVAPAPVAAPTPVPVAAPAPVAVPAPVVAPAPVMPAPPSFITPAAAPVASGAPFTDGKGLIDYVMSAYKTMGPQKGAQIQNVLTGLGYQNINDVKPEHYGVLFAGVEQLKVA